MRRLKRLLALSLALLCLLTLAGCHGTKRERGSAAAAPTEQALYRLPESLDESRTFEITFWAKSDNNKVQTAIYVQAIHDFEELYPNIRVRLKQYFDYGRIYQDVITNIATDTTPNVCITYPDHIATYLTGEDTVVPLDGLLDDPAFGLGGSELRFDSPTRGEIIPQFLSEGRIGGVQYAIPYMRSTEACYVNVDLVEKLGYTLPEILTWDFVWEVSEAALQKDADGSFVLNGQKVMKPFIYKSSDNMMIQMLRQLDAPYSTPRGEVLIFSDVTRSLLKEVAGHAAHGAFTTFKHDSYPGNFFNAGQCLFAIDSTAGATWMGSEAPLMDISADNVVHFKTEVMMIPQYDPANPRMISQGPSICVFRKADEQEVLAAWLFAQYLLTNEVRRGQRPALRRQDQGLKTAAGQCRTHLHHAGLQRLGFAALRRRRSDRRRHDRAAAQKDRGRRLSRQALRERQLAQPPEHDHACSGGNGGGRRCRRAGRRRSRRGAGAPARRGRRPAGKPGNSLAADRRLRSARVDEREEKARMTLDFAAETIIMKLSEIPATTIRKGVQK